MTQGSRRRNGECFSRAQAKTIGVVITCGLTEATARQVMGNL